MCRLTQTCFFLIGTPCWTGICQHQQTRRYSLVHSLVRQTATDMSLMGLLPPGKHSRSYWNRNFIFSVVSSLTLIGFINIHFFRESPLFDKLEYSVQRSQAMSVLILYRSFSFCINSTFNWTFSFKICRLAFILQQTDIEMILAYTSPQQVFLWTFNKFFD